MKIRQVGFVCMYFIVSILFAVSSVGFSQSTDSSATERKIDINKNKSLIQAPSVNGNRPILDPTDHSSWMTAMSQDNRAVATDQKASIFSSSTSLRTAEAGETQETIEVTADITTNTIWQASNIYHVTANINVQALLVIEPGTTVQFSSAGEISVNNGGTVIASGTPDNYIQFVADSGGGYGQYYSAIYLEETASVSSRISYSLFESAYVGVACNNLRLDSPIQNNIFYGCVFGIGETGTKLTDIFNNQIFGSYYDAINVDLKSISGVEDASTNILIQNNTCFYYQYDGITVYGVTTEANAGTVLLVNNIVSGSYYYGLNLANGYMKAAVVCTGYYGNNQNKNWEFDETAAVVATDYPFETSSDPLKQVYLLQSSPFVNAGSDGVALIPQILGFTTALNSDCDLGVVDIGFHYPNFNKVNVGEYYLFLVSDLDQDGTVNDADLTILRNHYGQAGSSTDGDINGDGIVDAHDLRIMRKQWGQTGYSYPDIQPDVPTGSLSGDANVGITGDISTLAKISLFLDGKFIGEFSDSTGNLLVTLETYKYGNGDHKLKIVGITSLGGILLSQEEVVTFSNTLYYVSAGSCYTRTGGYSIAGIHDTGTSVTVSVTDIFDTEVCSYPITNVPLNIPMTSCEYQVYTVNITITSEENLDTVNATSQTTIYNWNIYEAKPASYNNLAVLITFSSDSKDLDKACTPRIKAILKATITKFDSADWLFVYRPDWDLLSYLLTLPNLHYWYNIAHGQIGTLNGGTVVLRTNFDIRTSGVSQYDGYLLGDEVYSYKQNDLSSLPLNPLENYCKKLTDNEEDVHTIASLGLAKSPKLKIVFMDCCSSGANNFYDETGRRFNDMALALGMYSVEDSPSQVYFGWFNDIGSANPTDTTYISKLWSCPPDQGLGGPNSVKTAVIFANRYCSGVDLPGRLEMYGNTFQLYQYNGLELIYFTSD
jgi:hypothetical protein